MLSASSDHDVLGVQAAAQADGIARQGAARVLMARRTGVGAQQVAVALRGAHHGAAHAVRVEQLGARRPAAVRNDVHRLVAPQDALAQPVHRHLAGAAHRARRAGLGQAHRPRRHKKAGARARGDQARIFEPVVGLHHRGLRHAVLARQLTHRRQLFAARQGAVADQLRELFGDLKVQRGYVIGSHAAFCTGTLAGRQYRDGPVRTVQMGRFAVLYWARSHAPVAGGPRQLAAQ